MNDSVLTRFFGVVRRPETWLGILFNWLAFPLGLFYFVFLVTGLSLGVGLVVVWVGIPILLVVAGAWWLFGAFERVQARYLLRADVPGAPREWEKVEGVWAKLKAHFGSAATWKDLVYLLAKLPFGIVSSRCWSRPRPWCSGSWRCRSSPCSTCRSSTAPGCRRCGSAS